jgi:GntR family transcriptional regulator
VGIITVKRAYEELEKEGILSNLQGRGCFVNKMDTEKIRMIHFDMLKERMLEIKEFADTSGITQVEIINAVIELYGGCSNDK